MKSLRYRLLAAVTVALAAICASAVPADAQSGFKGSFTLTHEVRWQNVTLPAGDYRFEMRSLAAPSNILLNGPNGGAFILALVANKADSGKESFMTIEHYGARAVVRELYLGPARVRLRYSVPKAPKEAELAKGPVTTERVLVAVK